MGLIAWSGVSWAFLADLIGLLLHLAVHPTEPHAVFSGRLCGRTRTETHHCILSISLTFPLPFPLPVLFFFDPPNHHNHTHTDTDAHTHMNTPQGCAPLRSIPSARGAL